jgi:hypothetical protein
MELVQELLRPFVSELGEIREELGAERTRRQIAEEQIAALEAELGALREVRESPQTVEGEPQRAEQPHPATGEAQEGEQRSWWRRVFGSWTSEKPHKAKIRYSAFSDVSPDYRY